MTDSWSEYAQMRYEEAHAEELEAEREERAVLTRQAELGMPTDTMRVGPDPRTVATYDAVTTIYANPNARTIERMVREMAKRDGHTGTVTVLSYRPRLGTRTIKQYIDVSIRVTTTTEDAARRARDPFEGLS